MFFYYAGKEGEGRRWQVVIFKPRLVVTDVKIRQGLLFSGAKDDGRRRAAVSAKQSHMRSREAELHYSGKAFLAWRFVVTQLTALSELQTVVYSTHAKPSPGYHGTPATDIERRKA